MKRREFMTLIGSAVVGGAAVGGAAWPPVAGAQQPSGGLDDRLRKSIGDKDVPGVVQGNRVKMSVTKD
jgi:hypothetical protein